MLCKTLYFGAATYDKMFETFNKTLLIKIMNIAIKKTF